MLRCCLQEGVSNSHVYGRFKVKFDWIRVFFRVSFAKVPWSQLCLSKVNPLPFLLLINTLWSPLSWLSSSYTTKESNSRAILYSFLSMLILLCVNSFSVQFKRHNGIIYLSEMERDIIYDFLQEFCYILIYHIRALSLLHVKT